MIEEKNELSVQDELGNISKPLLCDAFIDALPHKDEKIIDKYTKQISTELYHLSKELEAKGDTNAHVNARCEINKKYFDISKARLNAKSQSLDSTNKNTTENFNDKHKQVNLFRVNSNE